MIVLQPARNNGGLAYNIKFDRTVLKYTKNSQVVTTIMFYLTDKTSNAVVDARSVSLPSITALMYWFVDANRVVHYGNGDRYQVYVFETSEDIHEATLYEYDINGYILTVDKDNLTRIIKDAWTTEDSSYKVTIYTTRIGYKENGDVVTSIKYLVEYNGVVRDARYYYGNVFRLALYINARLNTANGLSKDYTFMTGARLYFDEEVGFLFKTPTDILKYLTTQATM
ncbi:hypothetical protein MAR_037152 [Mya arenaria]|uniref:Uncharacterized protein n=1 Tax=Mya arenaria TaxID=6604 RepID=A0ABY7FRT1_MYAAR|nr:hypothetical protein MAR_037152 [Mya arenaria]